MMPLLVQPIANEESANTPSVPAMPVSWNRSSSLLVVLLNAVNPALVAEGLPEVSIRIGADHGPTSITEVTVPTTGFSEPTVKSDALNRAVKIQDAADANQFLIGRTLYERIHVHWLERCREESGIDLASKLGFDEYQIYSVS